ncbi:MAG: exo-alpha-sialidase [Thermoguttaceae bacterium]|nr:exo-alpha-sialidase [Thermoguttaceae bacterium]
MTCAMYKFDYDHMTRYCVVIFALGYLTLIAILLQRENDAPAGELTVAPAVEKTVVLELPSREGNPRNSEGDFIRLEDGEILFVYTKYIDASDDDLAVSRLVSRISYDDGDSWSEEDEIVFEDVDEVANVMSVSLARLRDNTIALFYLINASPGDCRPFVRYSFDEGRKWTPPREIIREPSYNVVNNDRVIQLDDGRLILPVARHAFLGGDVYKLEGKA